MAEKKRVGKVLHYYSNIGVAVIELEDTLKIGDKITIEGSTTNFEQEVESMQINKQPIEEATAGQQVGLKVKDKARENDIVYKIVE